jgi:hypothetical protein
MVSKLTIEIVLAISCYDSLQKTSIFKYKRPEASLYGFKSNLFYFLFLSLSVSPFMHTALSKRKRDATNKITQNIYTHIPNSG